MKKVELLSPFKTMLITIGNLPTSYIESMSYYEGLTYLVNYLCNNVIPAVNSSGEAVEELQKKYLELVDYVNEYFSDLNVQTEIDNKLDEMAEQGELTQLILDYLSMSGLIMFDTVDDLKAAENLIEGSFTKTLGKLLYTDGLGGFYKIRLKDVSDTPDDYDLVELTNYPTLIAERIVGIDEINISDLDEEIGDLTSLTTSEKSSVVGAVNEVVSDIGDLSTLTTTEKSSIVGAVNEVNQWNKFNLSVTHQAYRTTSDTDSVQITLGKFKPSTATFTTTASGMSNAYCNILGATNSDGSIGKLYGIMRVECNYVLSDTNGYPCIRLRCEDFGIDVPDEGYSIWAAGNAYADGLFSCGSLYIGSDGYIYVYPNTNITLSSKLLTMVLNPCIYFWTSFGDTPDNE